MGNIIQFKRPDGKTCPGYLASAKGDAGAPGFVVIQEWWGLNPQIKKTADRLAEGGYHALVPDLYRGKVASAADEAAHMMAGVNFPDAAEQDIRGAVQYLKQTSKKVAVGGFCMGGALTLLAAGRVPEMDAGACFYGIPPASNSASSASTVSATLAARARTRAPSARAASGARLRGDGAKNTKPTRSAPPSSAASSASGVDRPQILTSRVIAHLNRTAQSIAARNSSTVLDHARWYRRPSKDRSANSREQCSCA